jgi:hypothetical protein
MVRDRLVLRAREGFDQSMVGGGRRGLTEAMLGESKRWRER